MKRRKHYVYYCYEPNFPSVVVYVGRSFDPERRRASAELRYGIHLEMRLSSAMYSVRKACELERVEITRLAPRFNEYVGSALSMLDKHHSDAAKAKMSAAHKGRFVSAETRAKLSAVKLGVPQKKHTAAHNAKIAATLTGQKRGHYTADHRAKISAAHLAFHERKNEALHQMPYREAVFEDFMGSLGRKL